MFTVLADGPSGLGLRLVGGFWVVAGFLSGDCVGVDEVLGIARGTATVEFGGGAGETVELQAGDVAILPAGTGHRRLSCSRDLLVVGAYPADGCVDQHRPAQVSHDKAVADVAKTPLPQQDPMFGSDGPLKALWKLRA